MYLILFAQPNIKANSVPLIFKLRFIHECSITYYTLHITHINFLTNKGEHEDKKNLSL